MELNWNASRRKRTKRLYKFCLHQIKKIEPLGNLTRNLPLPVPRSGHRILVFEGNVFAFGGYSPRNPETDEIITEPNDRHLFKELWKFNCASKTWFNLETFGLMPTELASHAAVLIDGYMITYGGTGVPFGQSSSNNTHGCNLNSLEWFTLDTTGDKPLPLYGQAMARYNDCIYVVGGTTGYDYTISVHCFDIYRKVWKRLDNLCKQSYTPPPRYRHEIAIFDHTIFVLGGGTVSESYGFLEIPTFDLWYCTWDKVTTTAVTEFPSPRLCHGSVQVGNDVYICGGHDGRSIFSDIYKLNLEQLQWIKLDVEMPLPLYFHSVAASEEGQVFIFGGVTNTREEIRTNELFSIWVKIPSLSTMCWQALLTYIPDIARMDRRKLSEAGVPLKYLNEVEFDSADKLCCKFKLS